MNIAGCQKLVSGAPHKLLLFSLEGSNPPPATKSKILIK